MKAFNLIQTLLEGWLDIEQGGTFIMYEETDEQFIRNFFWAKRIVSGKFEVGEYVYFYEPEGLKLADDFEPDVIIEENNGQYILLWMVE